MLSTGTVSFQEEMSELTFDDQTGVLNPNPFKCPVLHLFVSGAWKHTDILFILITIYEVPTTCRTLH